MTTAVTNDPAAVASAIRLNGRCPRCRLPVGRRGATHHARACVRIPLPQQLLIEVETASVYQLALRYNVSWKSIVSRVDMARREPEEVWPAVPNRCGSTDGHTHGAPGCGILIFPTAAAAAAVGVPFDPRVNLDMGGACPGCAGGDSYGVITADVLARLRKQKGRRHSVTPAKPEMKEGVHNRGRPHFSPDRAATQGANT